jgi:hypothetical protein
MNGNEGQVKRVRWWLWMTAVGALAGSISASLLGAKVIAYWFEPPVSVGVSCRAPIEWALSKLQLVQMLGVFAGAGVGLIFYLLFRPKRKAALEPTEL